MVLLKLQLFAEGAAAGGDAGAPGESSGAADQTTNASVESQSSPEEDRAKAYGQFKSDYKAEFDTEVQGIVKDRLKKSNKQIADLNGQLKSYAPLIEGMAKKYGIKDISDINSITEAFLNDDANLEQEAYDRGMTIEQLKAFKSIERENEQLRAADEEREQQAKQQAQYAEWDRQAEECRAKYPTFDMETELQNEQFRRLMQSGVDVPTCFEIVHKDELMRGAMQYTAQKATEKVANAVISNKARPSENGLSSKSSSIAKTNISSLSREQMEDYKRRALAGEKIDFRN